MDPPRLSRTSPSSPGRDATAAFCSWEGDKPGRTRPVITTSKPGSQRRIERLSIVDGLLKCSRHFITGNAREGLAATGLSQRVSAVAAGASVLFDAGRLAGCQVVAVDAGLARFVQVEGVAEFFA